jgi:mannose-1-phosphate guanylyltransferase
MRGTKLLMPAKRSVNPPAAAARHLYGVILAGGRGTRFWPRSRAASPKQLMNFFGGASLLQQTVARLQPLIPAERIWVFTNELLLRQVRKQLPDVPPDQIIAEPVQRNTGPCAGLAAELIWRRDPDAVLGMFPSDQTIGDEQAFLKVLQLAVAQAARGRIVVLGIAPRWPETGYGYMEFAARPTRRNAQALPVLRFREKPELAVARRYLKAGRFFWNSGMFFWRAAVLREQMQTHLPETAAVLRKIGEGMTTPSGAMARGAQPVLRKLYPSCENISVDFAVLEKARGIVGIPCEVGWSDVGSWNAVYDLLEKDAQSHALRSEALLIDSSGLLVDVPGKLFAAIGVHDLVIVETPDALLLARRDRAQDVSQLVKQLESAKRKQLL